MKLLFYLGLLIILFQAVFASTSSNGKPATLTSKKADRRKAKKAAGRLVWKKKAPKPLNEKGAGKGSVVVKEDKPTYLSELLPKVLVDIVIGYLKDTYSILVSTHEWLLQGLFGIAVNSTRLYMITEVGYITGLNHSLANLKEEECRFIEIGTFQVHQAGTLNSSQDGRYVSFDHRYEAVKGCGVWSEVGSKWFAQSSELDGRFKPVAFEGENLPRGPLSRDGQRLFSYNKMMEVTRIYQIKEETGKDPTAFMKFELNGYTRAVSGNGDRIMVKNAEQLEIHDISKDTAKLVCRTSVFGHMWALNYDGSEAAFVKDDELHIVEVDKVVGDKIEPAIVKVPKPSGEIHGLIYSNENKLHVFHGSEISLFDPSMKAFIFLEALQEGLTVDNLVVSPNADYIATVQRVPEGEKGDGKLVFRTIVKRKLKEADLDRLSGHEADKITGTRKQAISPKKQQ